MWLDHIAALPTNKRKWIIIFAERRIDKFIIILVVISSLATKEVPIRASQLPHRLFCHSIAIVSCVREVSFNLLISFRFRFAEWPNAHRRQIHFHVYAIEFNELVKHLRNSHFLCCAATGPLCGNWYRAVRVFDSFHNSQTTRMVRRSGEVVASEITQFPAWSIFHSEFSKSEWNWIPGTICYCRCCMRLFVTMWTITMKPRFRCARVFFRYISLGRNSTLSILISTSAGCPFNGGG